MISTLAYGGDTERRRLMIDRISALCRQGLLASDADEQSQTISLIEALAEGTYDIGVAHKNSGFTAPRLQICRGLFDGLPPKDAPSFALALVKSARIDSDIGGVPWDFLKWMFDEAVAELGASRIRPIAREAGHVFKLLSESRELTATQQHRAKALTMQARRRSATLPTAEERFVAQALGTALDNSDEYANYAIYWIANLAEQPAEQYRRYAKRLLELVEAA